MSVSPLSNSGSTAQPIRRRKPSQATTEPQDGIDLGQGQQAMADVNRLIADFQAGKIRYNAEIQAKIRPQQLDLGNFPCKKYILRQSDASADSRDLPTEIVGDKEKPKYRKSLHVDSKLTLKETQADLEERVDDIRSSMNEVYAQHGESIMVLLEGDNAAGKDGMVKHVFAINPMTTKGQIAFKAATPEERQHDPNWRIMKNLAGPGQIMFHNRSHYGDVVFAAKTEDDKSKRLAEIREMEYGLTMGLPMTPEGKIALPDAQGNIDPSAIQRPPMRFIKVLLGTSQEEQASRLADRLLDKSKLYKVSQADLDGHPKHYKVQTDFVNAMAANSTPWAPTYYIPNDTKLTGWRKFAQISQQVLEDMDPKPPDNPAFSKAERKEQAAILRREADSRLRNSKKS